MVTELSLLQRLGDAIPSPSLSSAARRLRQEAGLWQALHEEEFLQSSIRMAGKDLGRYRPAVLGLLKAREAEAVRYALEPEGTRADKSLSGELQTRARAAQEALAKGMPGSISEFALAALSIATSPSPTEQLSRMGEAAPQVLIYLLGLLSDGQAIGSVLASRLPAESAAVIHAILANLERESLDPFLGSWLPLLQPDQIVALLEAAHDLGELDLERNIATVFNSLPGTPTNSASPSLQTESAQPGELETLLAARVRRAMGSEEASRENLEQLVESAKRRAAAWTSELANDALQRNDPVTALAAFQELQDLLPDSSEARTGMARAFVRLNRFGEALQLIPSNPEDPGDLLALAQIHAAQGNGSLARQFALRGTQADRREHVSTRLLVETARAMAAQGAYPEAFEIQRCVVDRKPSDPEVLLDLANYQAGSGNWDSARSTAFLAWTLDPTRTSALQVVAQGHEMVGDFLEAQDCWRRLVQDRPADSEAVLHLAQTSLQAGDSGQARDAARRLLAIHPDSGEAHAILGAALLAEGDLKGAQATLQQATQISPSSTLAWKALAELHEKGGDLESAAAVLRAGVESASRPGELLLVLGKLALRRGLPTEAAAALQRAVALSPRDPKLLQPLSEALVHLGRMAEAEQALRTALQVSPAQVELILALADLLETEGRLVDARAALESGLKVRPASTALLLRLGKILISLYHQGGDQETPLLRQAIDLLQPAQQQGGDPADPPYFILLGQALLLDGKPREALASFTRALPLESLSSVPSACEAHLGAAQAFLQLDDSASAVAHARLALQVAPDNPSSLQMLARACEAAGSLEEAREAYQRLLALVPDHVEALRGLALVLRRVGQTDQAVPLLQQATELSPNQAPGWADLAETLVLNNQIDMARQAMAKAVATASGKDREIPIRAAQFLMDLKEYAEAAQLLRDTLEHDPSDVRALDTFGQAMLRSGQFEESIEAFSKATDLEPANPDLLAHAAEAYWEDGRRGAAIALWKKAIGLGPKARALTARLADALLCTGGFGEAVHYFEKAIEIDPSNPQLLAAASQAALRSGDHAKALAWVRQAIEGDPGSLEARRLEAEIALDSGAPDEALRITDQLVSEAPEDSFAWALLAKSHACLGAPAPDAALQHPALLALQNALAHCGSSPEGMSTTAEAALLVEDYPSAIRLLEGLSQAYPDAGDYPLRLAEALTARAEAFFRWQSAHAADSPGWAEALSSATAEATRAALAQATFLGAPNEIIATLGARICLAFAHPDPREVEDLEHLVAESPSTPALVSLAQAHLRMGDPSKANQWAAQAAQLDPRNATACLALALAQWKMGKSDEALRSLGLASDLASFLPLPHGIAALIHAAAGNMEKAIPSLQKAVALAPHVSTWEHLLGQWLGARAEIEASIAHYQRAAEISPENPDYQISLARALRRDGDLQGAHTHYRQALFLSQAVSPQLLAEAGELALQAGNPQEATENLRRALETSSPRAPVEWGLCLARALVATGHRAEARRLVEKVGADTHYQGQSLSILAEIEESEGHLDQAAELLGRAASLLPDPFNETLHLAQLWTLSGKPERAVEALLAIEPAHPNSDALSHSLAEALLKLGKGEEALKRAQTAAEAAPRRGEHWLLIGRVARKLGQIDQALDAVRRARELDPKDWRADLELGLALESQQRWDLALEAYRAAARLNPTNSEVMYRMGVVLKNLRSYSEATDALRKAVQLNPSNLPAHKLLSAVMALGLVYGLPELAPDKR